MSEELFVRISESHQYKTSRDYKQLIELAKATPVVCILDYSEACKDVACTKVQRSYHDDKIIFEICARGISYIYAWEELDFIEQCRKSNVEFIKPGVAQ